jgi:hypothetical protein
MLPDGLTECRVCGTPVRGPALCDDCYQSDGPSFDAVAPPAPDLAALRAELTAIETEMEDGPVNTLPPYYLRWHDWAARIRAVRDKMG